VIDFSIPNKEKPVMATEFFKRIKYICTKEQITIDDSYIVHLIEKHFPDWRRVLNECQRFAITGDSGAMVVNTNDDNFKVLMQALKSKNFKAMRKWVVDNIDTEPQVIFRKVYDNLHDYLEPKSIPQIILIIADYQWKNAFVADHEINVVACLTEIMGNSDWK
tara:strand:- start:188 stop:676 length:489 start_codon:yes stop_codon:yes gene_type:complete